MSSSLPGVRSDAGTRKRSRFAVFERNLELELVPLRLKDTVGLTLICLSCCVEACGGVLFWGAANLRIRGETGWTGLAMIVGGAVCIFLTVWLLQPHKAVTHATHRIRHHVRRFGRHQAASKPRMTEDQMTAIESAWDRGSSR